MGKSLKKALLSLKKKPITLVLIVILVPPVVAASVVTLINIRFYVENYDFCFQIPCLREVPIAFDVQIGIVKAWVATASVCALIFGSYIALQSYVSSTRIGAMGNRIAHVGLFERFMELELARRPRLTKDCVDIYALYRSLFPNASNADHASDQFLSAVENLYREIEASSEEYRLDKSFQFEQHRRRVIAAASKLHITMDPLPRMDFLEVEEDLLGLVGVMCLVFASSRVPASPNRDYY